jgi:hypothetical protein
MYTLNAALGGEAAEITTRPSQATYMLIEIDRIGIRRAPTVGGPEQRALLAHPLNPVFPCILWHRREFLLGWVDAAHEHAYARELGAVGAEQPLRGVEARGRGLRLASPRGGGAKGRRARGGRARACWKSKQRRPAYLSEAGT